MKTLQEMLIDARHNPNLYSLKPLIDYYLNQQTTEFERQEIRRILQPAIDDLMLATATDPKTYLRVAMVKEGLTGEEPDNREEIMKWEDYQRLAHAHEIDFPSLVEAATRAAPSANRITFPDPSYLRDRSPSGFYEHHTRDAIHRIHEQYTDLQAVRHLIHQYLDIRRTHYQRRSMRRIVRHHPQVIETLLHYDDTNAETSYRIWMRLAAITLTDGYPYPYVALSKVRETYHIGEVNGWKGDYIAAVDYISEIASPRGQHLLYTPNRLSLELWQDA